MQIEILKFIQQIANPFWDGFFTLVSMLGEEVVLIALLGFLYWCVDKKLGYKIGFLYVLNAPLNFILKGIFNSPRPIGQPGVRTIYADTATGSSFPSGHSQLGGGLFYFLFKNSKAKVCKTVFLIIAVLIPISRMYLGVHYPADVVVGLGLGILMVYVSEYIFEKLYDKHTEWLMLFAVPPLVFCFVSGGEESYKMAGLVVAFLIGMVIEKKFIGFSNEYKRSQKIYQYVRGVVGVFVLRAGLKMLLPAGVWSGFIRYFVIGIYVTVLKPYVIKKLYNE